MSQAILLAFGAMILWGVGDFLIQRTIWRIGNLETLFWISASSSILLLPLVYQSLPALTFNKIFIMIVLGLVGFAGSYIEFESLDIGKLSVVEVILSLELPLTILLGVFFLREHLSLGQLILIVPTDLTQMIY